jgi:hypothetical protein
VATTDNKISGLEEFKRFTWQRKLVMLLKYNEEKKRHHPTERAYRRLADPKKNVYKA